MGEWGKVEKGRKSPRDRGQISWNWPRQQSKRYRRFHSCHQTQGHSLCWRCVRRLLCLLLKQQRDDRGAKHVSFWGDKSEEGVLIALLQIALHWRSGWGLENTVTPRVWTERLVWVEPRKYNQVLHSCGLMAVLCGGETISIRDPL